MTVGETITGPTILTGVVFVNGIRRIGWRGYASILDKQDPSQREPMTVRKAIALKLIPPRIAAGLRATANSVAHRCATPGVTALKLRELDDTHDALSRTYLWSKKTGHVVDMDATDAEKLLKHPHLGPAFYDLDLVGTDPRHDPRPVQPSNATLRYWATEAKRNSNPREKLDELNRVLQRN